MNCSQAQHAIQLDLDDELSPLRQRALHRHLAACATCQSYAQQLRTIHAATTRLAAATSELGGGRLARLLDRHEPSTAPSTTSRLARHYPRLIAVAAAIALCLLGGQIANQLHHQRSREIIAANTHPQTNPAVANPTARQLARVEFDPGADVIAIPKPTHNPNVTVLWIYPAIRTAEATPAPAIEPDTLDAQGARS